MTTLPAKPINPFEQPAIRLPVGYLAAWLLGIGPLFAVVSAAAVGLLNGKPWLVAALASAIAILIGTGIGLTLLKFGKPKPAFQWAALIVAASTVRNGAGLVAAIVLYFALFPAVGPFFTGFLAGAFAALVAEVMILRPALLSPASDARPTRSPLRSPETA